MRAAADLAGAPASELAADGHPAFGTDASDDLTSAAARAVRARTGGPARPRRRRRRGAGRRAQPPGRQASATLTSRPGARRAHRGGRGRRAGPDRRRRRPGPALPAPDGGRRAGAAASRWRSWSRGGRACTPPPPGSPRPARCRRTTRRCGPGCAGSSAAVLAASRPGHSYGDALTALDRGYAAEGAAGGWAGHYQGGPIGYAQREFEIAPGQGGSRWPDPPIAPATRSPGTPACPAAPRPRTPTWSTPAAWNGSPQARAGRSAKPRQAIPARVRRSGGSLMTPTGAAVLARHGISAQDSPARARPAASRFPDGAHFRIEIPSVEGPAVLRAVVDAGRRPRASRSTGSPRAAAPCCCPRPNWPRWRGSARTPASRCRCSSGRGRNGTSAPRPVRRGAVTRRADSRRTAAQVRHR